MSAPASGLTQGQALLMAASTGLTVAGLYYAQPLLHTIAQALGLSYAAAGTLVTCAQVAYALGLILLVPLGDRLESRRLVVGMTLLSAVGLTLCAWSSNLPWLLVGTALTGFFAVVAQVLVPLAATLASPERRGRAVGTVMSGLLLGILLARSVAGGLSMLGSWRLVYGLAALLMLGNALLLWHFLPRHQPTVRLSYPRLLASILHLFVEEPVLRWRALLGLLTFALFSMFWTPLAFLLASPPYGYSDGVIGLFGLAGAAGALAAGYAGRLADHGHGARGVTLAWLSLFASWGLLALGGTSLVALVLGTLLLDFAVQLSQVSNQGAVYALRPDARNRINAAYMMCYFTGGALGSAASAWLYGHAGWSGVVGGGAAVGALGLAIWGLCLLLLRRASVRA